MSEFRQVAVLGAGTMGHGFAQVFAINGRVVRLADRTIELAERGKQLIASNLEVVVEEGFLPAGEVEAVLARIRPTGELREAVDAAEFVIEAVFENLAAKAESWRLLDEYAPEEAVLASNTSSFDINELAALVTHRPERVIGTHWFNPPQIVPCVEVIPADVTSAETLDATVAFLRELGKEPAVTKSVPGFVGNRIQLVMAAEAYRCVEQGIALRTSTGSCEARSASASAPTGLSRSRISPAWTPTSVSTTTCPNAAAIPGTRRRNCCAASSIRVGRG
jgi:3-hydroxyacyl-CoA dehydrogenase